MNDQAKKNIDKYTSVGCELQFFIGTSKLRLFGELLAKTATNRTTSKWLRILPLQYVALEVKFLFEYVFHVGLWNFLQSDKLYFLNENF